MITDPAFFQVLFYIVSPIVTFLAVSTAYLAIYRQAKPNVVVHYEPSNDVGTVIDLVIHNYGGGSARDVKFSKAIPLNCWGIEKSIDFDESKFLSITIPVLAPGKELRYQAGQYGGLLSQIGDGYPITTTYKYRTPLRREKNGEDISVLDLAYMASMHCGNSPAYDLADAMKGRNHTIFLKTNKQLEAISNQLGQIGLILSEKKESDDKNA